MNLAWSVSEEHQFPSREIVRNCGPLLGRLDELLPCLYIAQYGASSQDLRARITDAAPGLFAVGARTGGDRPGVAPRVGLLLPLSRCRDAKARASLLEIPALIAGAMERHSVTVNPSLDDIVATDSETRSLLS